MRQDKRMLIYPVLLFLLSVLLTGAVRRISFEDTKGAFDQYILNGETSYGFHQENEGYDSAEKKSFRIIFKGDIIRIDKGSTASDGSFEVYLDGVLSDENSYPAGENGIIDIDYSKSYGELHIIMDDSIYLGGISIEAPAADIYLKDLNMDSLNAFTNAGSISCSEIFCEDMKLKSTSGQIYIYNTGTLLTEAETVSGNISVAGSSREFYIKTSAGSIYFLPDHLDIRADITTESGDIKAVIKEDEQLILKIDQKSGILDIPEMLYGAEGRYEYEDGNCALLNIKTDRGNIKIETK